MKKLLAFTFALFLISTLAHAQAPIEYKKVILKANGKNYAVNMVKVKLDSVKIKVGLAKGLVGRTQSLADIAKTHKAVAAINGCFFDAYTKNALKNPHHTLITNGQFVHLGNVGTTLGFTADNRPIMERVIWKIDGSRNGSFEWPNKWYAYWLNRDTTNSTITIFTPYWGTATNRSDGEQIVVSGGKVTDMGSSSKNIPSDGYVIYINGVSDSSLRNFKLDQPVDYRIIRKDGADLGMWAEVAEGLGAGPRLVTDGNITYDPQAEGFSQDKILSLSGARSAVGITPDGYLLMVTTSATVKELATVMKELGAYNAMNLDGGASSGLYYKGKYVTPPGRLISNALLIMEK
ncbi:MAG: phosphodiester glycosidase family protein [bacterium]